MKNTSCHAISLDVNEFSRVIRLLNANCSMSFFFSFWLSDDELFSLARWLGACSTSDKSDNRISFFSPVFFSWILITFSIISRRDRPCSSSDARKTAVFLISLTLVWISTDYIYIATLRVNLLIIFLILSSPTFHNIIIWISRIVFQLMHCVAGYLKRSRIFSHSI